MSIHRLIMSCQGVKGVQNKKHFDTGTSFLLDMFAYFTRTPIQFG